VCACTGMSSFDMGREERTEQGEAEGLSKGRLRGAPGVLKTKLKTDASKGDPSCILEA